MQITTLGIGHSLKTGQQPNEQNTLGGEFAALLFGQMQTELPPAQKQAKENGQLSQMEIAELIQFLGQENLMELEDGTEIAQKMLAGGEMDIVSLIKTHLQLSEQEFLSSLLTFLAGVKVEQTNEESEIEKGVPESVVSLNSLFSGIKLEQRADENLFEDLARLMEAGVQVKQQKLSAETAGEGHKLIETQLQEAVPELLAIFHTISANGMMEEMEKEKMLQKLAWFSEAVSKENVPAALTSLLEFLAAMDLEQFSFSLNKEGANVLKPLKFYQLLSKHELSAAEEKALNTLLEKAAGALKAMVKEEKAVQQKEMLNQIFIPFGKEAKQGNLLLFKPTYSPVLSQVFISDEPRGETLSLQQGNQSIDVNNSMPLPLQQMAKGEPFILMMEKSGQPVSTEQLIAQFEKILANSHLLKSGNTQRLLIRLSPEHLGSLKVELIQKDGGMIAKITAATSTAKEILESQLQTLKHAFASQNIQLDKLEVTLGSNQQERFLNRDPQQGSKGEEQEPNKEQKEQQSKDFSRSFAEALINTEV